MFNMWTGTNKHYAGRRVRKPRQYVLDLYMATSLGIVFNCVEVVCTRVFVAPRHRLSRAVNPYRPVTRRISSIIVIPALGGDADDTHIRVYSANPPFKQPCTSTILAYAACSSWHYYYFCDVLTSYISSS